MAHQRGIAGTAIWGICRDVATAHELGYPIYSSCRFMRTGKDRVAVAEIGGVIARRRAGAARRHHRRRR